MKKTVFHLLLLLGLQAQAASYTFPGNLPAGCSGSNGTYTCGTLTLAASDTVTIAAPKPAIITFTGAFTSGNGTSINSAGSASDLTLIVTGAFTLGSAAILNANVINLAAFTIGDGTLVGGFVAASTGSGVNWWAVLQARGRRRC